MNSVSPKFGFLLLAPIALYLGGCGQADPTPNPVVDVPDSPKVVQQIVDSEELILTLHERLSLISNSAKNLQIPDYLASDLFVESVHLVPWQEDSKGTPTTSTREKLRIWPEFLSGLKRFEHAKFYMIRGHFDPSSSQEFISEVGFAGLARSVTDEWYAIKAKCLVTWRFTNASANPWQIAHWKTKELKFDSANSLMFKDQLSQLIDDPAELTALRSSQHVEYSKQIFETGQLQLGIEPKMKLQEPSLDQYFRIQQAGQHPGISIVDYDNDGWDDLYICDEWRPNKMLRNIEGKKLVNVAAEIGLDIEGSSTSAIFVDVDNDGDQDVFVGCIFESCKLLINENGTYVDRTTENVSANMPKLTASISAADYNNDGLVDIYISTYGFPAGRKSSRSRLWLVDFLSPYEHAQMMSGKSKSHRILNAIGPPNLLLLNIGKGRFQTAPENSTAQLHHNTFQSSWCDYDQDGDQDLYVSNDFAPDFLLRNDGKDGFVDVTLESGGQAMLGFGMGASWADYDLDGDFDLYVSNMYSKAGKRITKQIEGLDDRFFMMAEGNRLFRNDGEKFQLMSDGDKQGSAGGKAGWSWGGQFADFNNDGREDIYVCSGFFTAPRKYASLVDL